MSAINWKTTRQLLALTVVAALLLEAQHALSAEEMPNAKVDEVQAVAQRPGGFE